MSDTPDLPIQTPGEEPIQTPESPATVELVDASLPTTLGGAAETIEVDTVEPTPDAWFDVGFTDGEGVTFTEEAPE